jgi:hypothetical protein
MLPKGSVTKSSKTVAEAKVVSMAALLNPPVFTPSASIKIAKNNQK